MSATKGAPFSFRGLVVEANQNIVHIRALQGGHEALIRRQNVLAKTNRPCLIGGKGIVKFEQNVWTWTPDTI